MLRVERLRLVDGGVTQGIQVVVRGPWVCATRAFPPRTSHTQTARTKLPVFSLFFRL